MRFIGNVIWFVLGGWYLSLAWFLGAAIFALTIIGLPLTRAAIEMAKMSAWPFGKTVVHIRELDGKALNAATATTGTVGVILFFMHLAAGVLTCLTIIGIPFGIQSFKLAAISFWPVGRRVVSHELASHARTKNAEKKYNEMRGS